MKGDAYDQLIRDLEAERFAPPTPSPPSRDGGSAAALRRLELYRDSIEFGHDKNLQQRLRAIS